MENEKLKKNVILNFISDYAGQGTIRNIWPFNTLNAIYAHKGELINQHSLFFNQDPNMLNITRTLYFQRQFYLEHDAIVQSYKLKQPKHKYKMVWDMDDMIWGFNELQGGNKYEGIPSYNKAWSAITADMKNASINIMNSMDLLTFSTQYLADYVKEVLGVKTESVVIPNTVPRAYYGDDRRVITKSIYKPTVIYTGSPTHYNNEHQMLGDWDNSWKDWVIKSVKQKEINFTCFGGLPWFFKEIEKDIKVIPWLESFKLHLEIKRENADFCINPLTPNEFNYSKSDLKLVECSAAGVACVGTVFTNGKPSPYDECKIKAPDDITVEGIDKLLKPCFEYNTYNNILKEQYKWIETEGRYTESPQFINKLVKAIT